MNFYNISKYKAKLKELALNKFLLTAFKTSQITYVMESTFDYFLWNFRTSTILQA